MFANIHSTAYALDLCSPAHTKYCSASNFKYPNTVVDCGDFSVNSYTKCSDTGQICVQSGNDATCQDPPPVCAANKTFCDSGRLKTCNSTGTGIVPNSTIDCTATGKTCVEDSTGAHCQESNLSPSPSPSPPIGQTGGASPVVNLNQLIDSVGFKTFKSTSTLGDIVNTAVPILFGIAGTALLLYLISGGFAYLTSAGDPKKLEAARNVITNAVIGFLIIISAYFITQAVSFIFRLGGAI